MIRRTLLSSLVALLLVATPAAALPSVGLPLSPTGWLTTVLDGFLDLFVVEKNRGQNDPNGEAKDDTERQVTPLAVTGPDLAVGPGTT